MRSEKGKVRLIYVPFIIVLVLMFFQYSHGFPQGDDFSFSLQGGSLEKIFDFYKLYYMVDGSRMSNLLAQLLLLRGLDLWKILTPNVVTGISLFFFYYIRGYLFRREEGASAVPDFCLACLCASFPGLIPLAYNLYGDTFFWLAGSCNYLYPFFFMLGGILPVYNRMRGRPVPAFFRFASPVLFVAAGLLHEQIALALFGMSLTAFLILAKDRKEGVSLLSWCLLSLLLLLYTFTCPGAYRRFRFVGAATGKSGLKDTLLKNLPLYLGTVFHSFGFWIVLLGLCCLYLLRGGTFRGKWLPVCYLSFGVALFAVSEPLNLPMASEDPETLRSRTNILILTYWIVFLLVCFAVMIWAAKRDGQYRYLVMLFVGICAAQMIPALMGAQGRPLSYMIFVVFLMAASLFQHIRFRYTDQAFLSFAAVGLCSILLTVQVTLRNYRVYGDILDQMNRVGTNVGGTVVIDQRKFNTKYMYFNSFSPAYSGEIKRYYQLPGNTSLIILP